MSDDPYLGEIAMSPLHFVPKGWASCEGQLLAITSNQALFALLGTRFGGDGKTSFALPDLRGRVPVGPGESPSSGITFTQGDKGGAENVPLSIAQMPTHRHMFAASSSTGTTASVQDGVFAGVGTSASFTPAPPVYGPLSNRLVTIESTSMQPAGGGQAHNNIQPGTAIGYIIALVGIMPSRGP